MPSWMEQESLWKTPRTQSAQWNIEIQYVEYKMELGCRTITGSTVGRQVDAKCYTKTHSSFNKNNNII
jgi:hypothetical protein